MMEMEKVYEQASAAIDELFAAADTLKRGDILVIGCSTSEIVGKRIGSGSSVEAAKAVMDAVLPKIKARDANIHYHVQGEGEPLLLITGFSGDLYNWKKAIPLLDDSYKVITFDNRGSGHTEAPDAPFTIETMADDAAALLDLLRRELPTVTDWAGAVGVGVATVGMVGVGVATAGVVGVGVGAIVP